MVKSEFLNMVMKSWPKTGYVYARSWLVWQRRLCWRTTRRFPRGQVFWCYNQMVIPSRFMWSGASRKATVVQPYWSRHTALIRRDGRQIFGVD